MTFDEAKIELSTCRYMMHDIAVCKDEITQLQQELLFTSSMIRLPDIQNPLISAADEIRYRLDAAVTRYTTLINYWETLKTQIENRISDVKKHNYVYGEILQLRFIRGCKFEKIALEMNYSYVWVKQLSKRAIHTYAMIHEKKLKNIPKHTCQ